MHSPQVFHIDWCQLASDLCVCKSSYLYLVLFEKIKLCSASLGRLPFVKLYNFMQLCKPDNEYFNHMNLDN